MFRPLAPACPLALALVFAATGCHTPAAAPQHPAPAAAEPALAQTSAVWALPADTEALIVAGNLAALVEAAGIDQALKVDRAWYENAVADIARVTGHNLLDPQSYAAIGLDATGAWGLAVLDVKDEVAVIFAPVTDAEKLKAACYRTAAEADQKLHVSAAGDGVVIAAEGEDKIAVLIDGELAFFVGVDDTDNKNARAVAAALATRASSESLGATDAYQHVTGKLSLGTDVAGYIAPAFFVTAMDFPENAVGAAAFGAEIEPAAVRAQAFVDVPAGSPLSGLFKGKRDFSNLLAKVDEADVLVGARIDFAAFLRLDDADEVLAELSEKLGVDVKREIATGLAIASDGPRLTATPVGTSGAGPAHPELASIFAEQGSAALIVKPAFVRWWLGADIAAVKTQASGSPEPSASPETRALEQKLAALQTQLVAERERRDEKEAKAAAALYEKIGILAVRVDVEGDALRLTGGQFFGQPLAATVTGVVADVAELSRIARDSWRRREDLYVKIRQTRAELEKARERDKLRAAKKHSFGALVGTGVGGGGQGYGTIGLGTLSSWKNAPGYGPAKVLGSKGGGALPKAIIQRVVRRNRGRFRYCYEKQLAKTPGLTATIKLRFTIDAQGRVTKATARAKGAQTKDTRAMSACIAKVARGLRFPKPKGGGRVTVNYPFIFATN